MADLTPLNYDPAKTEDVGEGGFRVIPPGTYIVMIVASELQNTKAGNGKMLVLTYQIIEGREVGGTLIDRINIIKNHRFFPIIFPLTMLVVLFLLFVVLTGGKFLKASVITGIFNQSLIIGTLVYEWYALGKSQARFDAEAAEEAEAGKRAEGGE